MVIIDYLSANFANYTKKGIWMPIRQALIFKEEVFQVVGAAMEVHNQLGCGFLEPVYHEALEIEFSSRGIPFKSQVELSVCYKGHPLKKQYIPDFVTYEKVIVEIKAIDTITSREEAQLINYLRASSLQVGLLINFGSESLEWKRRVLTLPTIRPNTRRSINNQ